MISDPFEVESIKQQIIIHKRRLRLLEQKSAYEGRNVDPEIVMEIQDIEVEIKKLEGQLPKKSFAEITLDEDPDSFPPEKIEDTRRVVAALLDISPDQIQISFLRAGSVVLLVQLPKEAMDRLVPFHSGFDKRILDKKVESIYQNWIE